jgi:chromosome transmission fidelity protein 18
VKTSTIRHYGDQLWVDKYAPKSFVDLLSEEKTNRNFLRALKEWDPYVFGRSNATAPLTTTAATLKDDVRPPITSRVFLLCGNAGVGKTTLAHIAAKHAGYRPIEINASDDRSPQILKEKVLRAMESTLLATYTKTASNGTRRPKPNCIILDEVDGIDSVNAIHALLDIIKQDINNNSNKPYLRRPIIFIANHKYAAALKPLLNYAMVFDVQPPLSSRIVSRCKTVLSSENISIQDNQLLTELVHGSGGDIRSCLHTLQYVALSRQQKKQRHQQLDASCELSAALSGTGTLKDTRGDIAAVLYAVFWNRKRSGGSEIISGATKKKVFKKKDSGYILHIVEVSTHYQVSYAILLQ